MWWTPDGHRVLTGAEAQLFQAGVTALVTGLDESSDYRIGMRPFDKLSIPEKFAALEQVTAALLVPEVASPNPTAVLEGTIAAVFRQLLSDVKAEIDLEQHALRPLILAAAVHRSHPREDLPHEDSKARKKWRILLDSLMDEILWDRDWEDEIIQPDDSPERAEYMRMSIGITPEYYTDVPADPTTEQLKQIRTHLKELCAMESR